jgi:hypothetical protein
VSALILVPCVWHRRVEAGDLASHVYNAWLAQLTEKGQAPGLYIVRQWNNVLFDWMLLRTANVLGFASAEKIVVSICVLIFFWGVFALMAAASGHPPWFLTPCVAMLAYGYSFSMGFLNYYLSIGLACFSLALLWRGRGLGRLVGLGIIPFVWLAHPLGFLWLAGTFVYVAISSRLPKLWSLALPVTVGCGLMALKWYLVHRTQFPVEWPEEPFFFFNGADQLALYGQRYITLAWGAALFGIVSLVTGAFARRRDLSFWELLRVPLELYLAAICAAATLPESLHPPIYAGWIGLVVSRLTTITAILGLCVMSCLKPQKWQLAGFAACAAAFFAFLYQDTASLNRMEANAERLVRDLPFGTKVVTTIKAPEDWRVPFIDHVVDRACIGHCFSYANYEPSSGQFRVRVRLDSPAVTAFEEDGEDMTAGEYEVQGEDLPMKVIYQCDLADRAKLCLADLAAGEKTGSRTPKAGSN